MESSWLVLLLAVSLACRVSDSQRSVYTQCNGEVTSDYICYTFRPVPANFSAASAECRKDGGHLASMNSLATQTLINSFLTRIGFGPVWIGLSTNDKIWTLFPDNSVLGPQGCYIDMQTSRDLPEEVTPPIRNMTAESCIAACIGMNTLYSGTQNGTRCFCGNSFGRYNTSKLCVMPCQANTSTSMSNYCGGNSSNFVYYNYGVPGRFGFTQPNNYGYDQGCGIIDTAIDGKFADEKCAKNLSYICDMNRGASSNCNGQGYHRITGRCYYIGENKLSWLLAREACQRLDSGAHLLAIKTRQRHLAITDYLYTLYPFPQTSVQLWIGLTKGGWFWSSGEPTLYSNWAPGSPSSAMDRTCALMTNASGNTFNWVDRSCSEQHFYICQTDLDPDNKYSTVGSTTRSTTSANITVGSSTTTTTFPSTSSTTTPTTTTTSSTTTPTSTPTSTTLSSSTPSTSISSTSSPVTSSSSSSTTASPSTQSTIPKSTASPSTASTTASALSTGGGSTADVTGSQPITTTDTFIAPVTAQKSTDEAAVSNLIIVLIVLCCILVILAIAIVLVWYCYLKPKRKASKVDSMKTYDARPIAPVPNSGSDPDYDYFASTINLNQSW